MLDVKKRAGMNMIDATSQVREIVDNAIENYFPKDLKISITNDQSNVTITQVDDLVNNIVFGIILVVTVLMFFLGFKNALFVGFAPVEDPQIAVAIIVENAGGGGSNAAPIARGLFDEWLLNSNVQVDAVVGL